MFFAHGDFHRRRSFFPCTANVQNVVFLRRFYVVAVEAGKVPPARSLEELSPTSPYVIMMDKKRVAIGQ